MAEKRAGADKSCILIVDDEKLLIEALRRSLETHEFEVIGADSYESAVDVLEDSPKEIEAIVCDLKMPGESGLEVLRYVNKKELHIPLIFLTGHATLQTCQQALREGAFDYVMKPPERDTLVLALTHAAEKYRLRKENREMRKDILRLAQEHERFFDSLIAHVAAKEETEKRISQIIDKWEAIS